MSSTSNRHHLLEDIQALFSGTLIFAFALLLLRQAELLTGGTAGLAFLAYYASDLPFGLLYFLINLPFYVFGLRALGVTFTVKTFCAGLAPQRHTSERCGHRIQVRSCSSYSPGI